MASRLEFRESNHTYWLDGCRVPGVTTTINRAHDKPQLTWAAAREAATWAAENVGLLDESQPARWIREANGYYRELWSAKADRGTMIHAAALQLVAGHPFVPETDGEPWPDDMVATTEQAARFMDEWDVEPEWTERPVFHDRDRWGGTVDLIAMLRDGRRWLLDYKTGSTGIYPKDALQLATYRKATHIQVATVEEGLTDYPMPEVDECACVWLQPDFYELRPVLADAASYRVFVSMLPVAEWTTWKRDDVVAPPLDITEAS